MARKKIYNNIQEREKASYSRNYKQKLEHKKRLKDTLEGRLRYCLNQCQSRARRKGNSFELTLEFLIGLWQGQQGKCAISKLEMQLPAGNNNRINPFVLSVDRKDSSLGYTKENVQLVCATVNLMKHQFTYEEFKFWIRTISREAFNDCN